MTQPRLRELVRASNPVVDPNRLLAEEREAHALYSEAMRRAGNPRASADLLDLSVERRRDMQTQQRPTEIFGDRSVPPPRRRWVAAAIAAAVVVIVIGAGAFLSSDSGGTPPVTETPTTTVAPPTTTVAPTTTTVAPATVPFEVTDALNEAATTADWAAVSALFADSATLQFVGPEGPSPQVPFADPMPGDAGIVDWNADGVVTQLDWFLRQGAEIYAGHTTAMLDCEASEAGALVCAEVREGFAFKAAGHDVSWTLTVEDGQITALVFDLTQTTSNGSDPVRIGSYRNWVADNRPELVDGLFADFVTLDITPENLDTHRELVAEWVAAG